MDEGKSLKETLAEVSDKLDKLSEEKKVKAWSLPWNVKMLSKKKKRQGYVVFVNIGVNKAVTFIKAPIEEGVALVNGVPHVVDPKNILLWKNKLPIVIQPQWSEKPLDVSESYAEAKKNGQTTEGWEYIMNFILKTQIKVKKAISTGLIIIGIIAVVGLGYYLVKSGALQ